MERNPYAPPVASVEEAVPRGAEILEFPRFSAWWVLLLTIVTLSFYELYWLYSLTRIMNRVMPQDPIYMGLCWSAIMIYLVNIGFGFVEGYYGISADAMLVSQSVNIVSAVLMLIWVFSLRNRLNRLVNEQSGSVYYAGPILTFFFQVIYLAYKINQLHDRVRAEVSR